MLQFSSATPGRPIGDRAEIERCTVPKAQMLRRDPSSLAMSQLSLSAHLRVQPVDASRLLADG